MGRMKAHWPYQVNPQLELRSAKYWLEAGLKQDRGGSTLPPDIYRVLNLVQAIAIIDAILETK